MALTSSDYIRYLLNEFKRHSKVQPSDMYQSVLDFIKTSEGQKGFAAFQKLNPNKVGVIKAKSFSSIRKMGDLL